MSIAGVAKPVLHKGQGMTVPGVAGQEHILAPQPLLTVSWSSASVGWRCSTVGGISFQVHVHLCTLVA